MEYIKKFADLEKYANKHSWIIKYEIAEKKDTTYYFVTPQGNHVSVSVRNDGERLISSWGEYICP